MSSGCESLGIHGGSRQSRRPVRARRSVAVLGFRNLTGRPEDNWLSTAFYRDVEYGAGRRRRTSYGVGRRRGPGQTRIAAGRRRYSGQGHPGKTATNPGADVVVLGAYTLLPGKGENRIRLDIRLQDTAAGETIAEKP